MGTGKGNVEYYVAVVKPGRILYELAGVDDACAQKAFTPRRPQAARLHQDREARHGALGGTTMATLQELRDLSPEELRNARGGAGADALRAQEQGRTPACSTRPPTSSKTKRDIARCLTVAREKELRRGQGPAGPGQGGSFAAGRPMLGKAKE